MPEFHVSSRAILRLEVYFLLTA